MDPVTAALAAQLRRQTLLHEAVGARAAAELGRPAYSLRRVRLPGVRQLLSRIPGPRRWSGSCILPLLTSPRAGDGPCRTSYSLPMNA